MNKMSADAKIVTGRLDFRTLGKILYAEMIAQHRVNESDGA